MLGAHRSAAKKASRAIRQSVTIPPPLAVAVRRVAKERQLTISRALVSLAERGVRAEREEKNSLKASYQRFLGEKDPAKKDAAGRDLIRSIFGDEAIAEDSVL
jgi:hypothetical protein